MEHGVKGPALRVRRPVRLPLPQSHKAVVCADGTHLAVLALDTDPASPAALRILAPDTLAVERELPVARDPQEAFLTLAEAHRDGTALMYSVTGDGREVVTNGRGTVLVLTSEADPHELALLFA